MHYKISLLVLFVWISFSCINSKKAIYFADLKDSTVFSELKIPAYTFQENDLLSITVNSLNPEASRNFNLPNQPDVRTQSANGITVEPAGYLVDQDGNIELLLIGAVRVKGSTKEEIETTIRNILIDRKLLIDPVVKIRHLNFKVTLLGEVSRPTVITVTTEKISILEALGLAGDLTIFGKRTDVLIIRTEDGKRVANRINLNTTELIDSPFFYLRPNDVIYVEPNKARIESGSRFTSLVAPIVSSLSILAFAIDRLLR